VGFGVKIKGFGEDLTSFGWIDKKFKSRGISHLKGIPNVWKKSLFGDRD
jgi:hypothetical protein